MTPSDTVYTSFIDGSSRRLKKSELDTDDEQAKLVPMISPATNQPVFWFLPASEEDVAKAIEGASTAFQGNWSHPSQAPFRAQILRSMAQQLRTRVDALADLEVLQIGRPRKEMRFQLSRLPEWFEYFASLISVHEDVMPPFGQPGYTNQVHRVPLGVIAQITPFNHPLLITIKKLAPAIAAGNTVVIKPSELAPASIVELAELCTEAGLPSGVMQVVLGGKDVCARLLQDSKISKVDFTGGPTTGKIIGRHAGNNLASVTQELGGKAPMIVFAPKYVEQLDDATIDAYVDPIVNGLAFGAFIASGQTCIAGTRILVEESIYELVVSKLVAKTKVFRMGNPLDMTTTIGPVITKKHIEWLHEHVHNGIQELDPALQIACGGKPFTDFSESLTELNDGNYYQPTVIAVAKETLSSKFPSQSIADAVSQIHHTSQLFQTELFGPVVVMAPFVNQEHAIALANDTDFSLGCSIWTKDLQQANQVAGQVQAGIVWVNDHHKNHPSSPWGGLTKMSGIGRENGLDAFREYTQTKSIVINSNEFTSDWFQDSNARYN